MLGLFSTTIKNWIKVWRKLPGNSSRYLVTNIFEEDIKAYLSPKAQEAFEYLFLSVNCVRSPEGPYMPVPPEEYRRFKKWEYFQSTGWKKILEEASREEGREVLRKKGKEEEDEG